MARRPPRRTKESIMRGSWFKGVPDKINNLQDRMDDLRLRITFGTREVDVYFAFNLRYDPHTETVKEVHENFFSRRRSVLKQLGVMEYICFPREESWIADVRPNVDPKKVGSTEEQVIRFLKRFCSALGLESLEHLSIKRKFEVRVREDGELQWVNEGTWMLSHV